MVNITAKLLAAAVLESSALQKEIIEKSSDSETQFLGVRKSSLHGFIVEKVDYEPVLEKNYQGLNLGQSCLKQRALKTKLLNVIKE